MIQNTLLTIVHITTSRSFAHLMRNILYILGIPPGEDQRNMFTVMFPRPTLKWPSIN
jgi:hypothetical protein